MVRPRRFQDEDILDSARQSILNHGPSVSTALIAQQAGVSQATLFKRFGSKDELIMRALLPRAAEPPWLAFAAPPDERPVVEQLVERGRKVMQFFRELQPCLSMLQAHNTNLLDEMARSGKAPPLLTLRAVQRFFEALIQEGRMRPCNTEHLALQWMGALRTRTFWKHTMPGMDLVGDDEAYLFDITQNLWHGVCPREESR